MSCAMMRLTRASILNAGCRSSRLTWSRAALVASHGVWLAMKGKHPEDEIRALPTDVSVFHVEQLTVPCLDAERCIIWMKPA